ncbi:hypothetical protein ASE00_18395 [Sphingomonas sp. Root710]|uniref:hypothetical protein n=1 Tax=Sphingomonas sp. Root710 TaxID=1736594 RepID=UPI000700C54D|nr:hypothetical protein [Sphingomonas sp. Root710]KRB79688.1 hypothetical protein ASE00_18395 [Sphingomonas sp. Root710]
MMATRTLIGLTAMGMLAGCGGVNSKTAWNDVLKHCANSSLNGKKILYFGPTNAVGPGSIWRKDDKGVFRLRYDLSQMPKPQGFTGPYAPTGCDGQVSTNFKLGLDASLDVKVVSAAVKNDLSKARSVTAKAESISWVPIAEGPFENYVRALPVGDSVKDDVLNNQRYILTRALKVSGFSTEMTFSSEVATDLKAKYPDGPLPGGVAGSVSGGLSLSWSTTGTLKITSTDDFYIAGEFQQFKADGFAAAGAPSFGEKVDIGVKAKAARDDN